ncbi:MAG: hypothetical protein Tsb004_30460 [Allomuricauda sp.]
MSLQTAIRKNSVDHLGNVRAVFTKTNDDANLEGYTDYYPFGMPMPGRTLSGAEGYRYAFQGQEKDPETGKEAFQLRIWDGRIGRWLSPDPYGQFNSPYLGMGNNPILANDPNGGFICHDPDGNVIPCPQGQEHLNNLEDVFVFDGDNFLAYGLDGVTVDQFGGNENARLIRDFTSQAFDYRHNEKYGLTDADKQHNSQVWPDDRIQPYLLNPWRIDISELPDAESQGYGIGSFFADFYLEIDERRIPLSVQYSPTDYPSDYLSKTTLGTHVQRNVYSYWNDNSVLIGNTNKDAIFVVDFKSHNDRHHVLRYLNYER